MTALGEHDKHTGINLGAEATFQGLQERMTQDCVILVFV